MNDDKRIDFLNIFLGVFRGIILLLILSIIIAFLLFLNFVDYNNHINEIIFLANFLIIFYIGFSIARKIDTDGWLNGAFGGIFYMIVIVLLGSFSITISFINIAILILISLFIAGLGGIIGINY